MTQVKNKSVKVIVTKNNKVIHSRFDSWQSIADIKNYVRKSCKCSGKVQITISGECIYKFFGLNTNK